MIVKEFYSDNQANVQLYKGLPVLAIDGSSLQLPLSNTLKKVYGTFNNQNLTNDLVLAQVSVLYDLLNNIVLDGKLSSFKIGELTLARQHFPLATKGDLIIMDRAYPSFQSMYALQERQIQFLYRCKVNFSKQVKAFYESGTSPQFIEQEFNCALHMSNV